MSSFFQNAISMKLAKLMPGFWAVLTIACLQANSSWAQPSVPAALQGADWINGPGEASLGSAADIKIPQGYSFTDAQGARAYLQVKGSPIPEGLVGILMPDAGDWRIILKYSEPGYVKDVAAEDLNAQTLLKDFEAEVKKQNTERGKKGLPALTISWELNPTYDPNDHTVEWALRAKSVAPAGSKTTRSEDTVNQTVGFLGRRGILDAIVVVPYRGFTDLVPLKKILKGLSFKEGQRYADYQPADKVSNSSLAQLIVKSADPESEASKPTQANTFGTSKPLKALWIMLPVLLGLAVAGIVVVVRLRSLRPNAAVKATEQTVSAPSYVAEQPIAENIKPATTPVSAPIRASIPSARKPMLKPTQPAKSAFRSRRTNGQDAPDRRGKKVFDYNRYFNDLMSAVSHYSSGIEPISLNETPTEETNGFHAETANKQVNGNEHPPDNRKAFEANAEIIAQQTSFIEEQRRLMQEQSRLIEEKSRLIAEKNALLKMQSELLENKML
jgi:uncharacterized membrane-anchored protein